MKSHPIAELFPPIEGREFDEMVADIRERGLIHPIVLFEDKILDGRNRWRACKVAKVEPRTTVYRGKDPVGYAISANVARRHLDESQRAMVAARLATLQKGANQHGPIGLPSVTQSEAASKLNVGERSVKRARAVLTTGTPELVHAVERGKIAVSAASKMAAMPAAKQVKAVAQVEAGVKPSALLAEGKPSASPPKAPMPATLRLVGAPELTNEPWDEEDALVDVRDTLAALTRQWAERAESYELLRREAVVWAHELGQKEEGKSHAR
jgi:hypothetical protein